VRLPEVIQEGESTRTFLFREKNMSYNEVPYYLGGTMSEQLSSNAAKGFAIAGAAVLGLIVIHQTGRRVARVWRNWRSDEKLPDATEK
jgi:hypothetical protein